MNLPPVGQLGGRDRAVLRHLQRRGSQDREALVAHFIDGRHEWYPEDLDRALSNLVDQGYVEEPDEDGLYLTVLRSPL